VRTLITPPLTSRLPISYEDAIPLLNTLKGHGTPASELGPFWEGGLKYLGVEYWTGPGDRDVNFVNEVDTKITPIWSEWLSFI
jgi:N-acetylated-alpha-linked acidic dipeptidase